MLVRTAYRGRRLPLNITTRATLKSPSSRVGCTSPRAQCAHAFSGASNFEKIQDAHRPSSLLKVLKQYWSLQAYWSLLKVLKQSWHSKCVVNPISRIKTSSHHIWRHRFVINFSNFLKAIGRTSPLSNFREKIILVLSLLSSFRSGLRWRSRSGFFLIKNCSKIWWFFYKNFLGRKFSKKFFGRKFYTKKSWPFAPCSWRKRPEVGRCASCQNGTCARL